MRHGHKVTALLGLILALGAAQGPSVARATSVVAPSTEYHAVSRVELVAIVKNEFARVGLVLGGQTEAAGERSHSVDLTFDYAPRGEPVLTSAVHVSIVSQGERGNECLDWPCQMWFPGPRTHDPALANEIWAAHVQAMTAIDARILERGGSSERKGW